jgi:uracil DNA glycosylase
MKLINIKDGWYNKLKHVIESEQFSELGKFIAEERKTKEIYPLKNEVFRIFNGRSF